MPYIRQEDRELYDNEINKLVDKLIAIFSYAPGLMATARAGHLNYIITVLLKRFYKGLIEEKFGKGIRYSDYNEIIGMLECCKQEFYRRQVAEYEDEKIKSEGDVN